MLRIKLKHNFGRLISDEFEIHYLTQHFIIQYLAGKKTKTEIANCYLKKNSRNIKNEVSSSKIIME